MANEVYTRQIMAAIADKLRPIDRQRDTNLFLKPLLSGEFQREFGSLNFAGLEQVFRMFDFNTYCLAAPEALVAKRVGDILTVMPDDALKVLAVKDDQSLESILKDITFATHVAFLYPGQRELYIAVADWGISYDPALNLVDLGSSGIMVPKPNSDLARRVAGLTGRN